MSQSDKTERFDGEFDVLEIRPKASESDIHDMITQRLTQLYAMMSVHGIPKENETETMKQHRSNHLWLFNRTVREVESLGLELFSRHTNT